jgi:hypothetical protein
MKQTRTPKPSPAAPAPAALHFTKAVADLEPHIAEATTIIDGLTAEMLSHPDNASFSARPDAERKDDQQADALDLFRKLMNGSAEGHEALKHKGRRRRYGDISDERDTAIRTKELMQKLHHELTIRAKAELGEARKAEFDALMKQKAHALIGLERIEQAIDATCKGTDLQRYQLAGAGRLRASGSPLHTFLEWCARTGIITEREFADEVKRARSD